MGIRRFILLGILLFASVQGFTQLGKLKGTVSDAGNKELLVGATVMLQGTTVGTITDFDGNYIVEKITPGIYNVQCSFISYETKILENIEIKADQELVLDFVLGESTVEIGGVEVVAKANRETEAMLLLDQKEASVIKESIGSRQLTSMGVSDAATATSKISGVTKNEGSGDVYIRGLGDRYLTTTMNGLPIPSDDVEKKNIDLNLFSTDIIKNVGISKTYSVETYADQSSGAVDISSKTFTDKISIGVKSKISSNVLSADVFSNFKATQNANDLTFGLYSQTYATKAAIKYQSWNTTDRSLPLGAGFSASGGKKVKLFDKDLSIFATLGHENEFEHNIGLYKKYRSNVLDNYFSDAETFSTNVNTTGLLNLEYKLQKDHTISLNSLVVIKTKDVLYEQGRNGEGYVFDQDPQEEGAFVRDQNLKLTKIFINQVLGTHKLNDKNNLDWALGVNMVNADEPNRIRNEVNILDENTVQFAHVGDFQQRKSNQYIKDIELNGFVKNQLNMVEEENKNIKLNYGANFRMKQRDFSSLFIGVRAKGVQVQSIDNLDEAFLDLNKYTSTGLILKERLEDLYDANLNVFGGYVNTDISLEKLSGNVGVRYEMDYMKINWDVANYVGRKGNLSNTYNNVLPGLNLKYELSEKSSLRLAASKTVTLPEFKELSPFEYVSPTGRVTKGNPDLKNSVNYNVDVKWEMFPDAKQLFSVTGFYKMIQDPINLAQTRGSSGNFIYENTGEKANVYGFEFETRLSLLNKEGNTSMPKMNLIVNATKMWFNQDLLEEFQYNNKTETNLQGAAGFIANGTVSYSNNKEKEFVATISGNYSSDKILALGSPEDFANSATLFNNEIIEKGFTTVDMVISKKLSPKVSIKLSGKNLLNPKIQQTQEIKPLTGEAITNEIVSSYKKGVSVSVGVNINLN